MVPSAQELPRSFGTWYHPSSDDRQKRSLKDLYAYVRSYEISEKPDSGRFLPPPKIDAQRPEREKEEERERILEAGPCNYADKAICPRVPCLVLSWSCLMSSTTPRTRATVHISKVLLFFSGVQEDPFLPARYFPLRTCTLHSAQRANHSGPAAVARENSRIGDVCVCVSFVRFNVYPVEIRYVGNEVSFMMRAALPVLLCFSVDFVSLAVSRCLAPSLPLSGLARLLYLPPPPSSCVIVSFLQREYYFV